MDATTVIARLLSILQDVIISMVSTGIVIFLLLKFVRPKIEIADKISKKKGADGKFYYYFKFVNKTGMPIYDVQVLAYFLTPDGAKGGLNLKVEPIQLKQTQYNHIGKADKRDRHALHAVRVPCVTDLLEQWTSNSKYVCLEIIAKHELSGFSKITKKDYFNRGDIVEGDFEFGDSLNISEFGC